jgi:hypothetical protein
MAVEIGFRLLVGGCGNLGEKRFDREHHPRGAKSALKRAFLKKSLLNRVEPFSVGEAFDRGYLRSLR